MSLNEIHQFTPVCLDTELMLRGNVDGLIREMWRVGRERLLREGIFAAWAVHTTDGAWFLGDTHGTGDMMVLRVHGKRRIDGGCW